MSHVIHFRVYGLPQTKGSTKSFFVKKLNRVVTTNDNEKNKNWAVTVAQEAAVHRPSALWLGPITLHLNFLLAKPKSLPKRRLSWPTKKPDWDKLARSAGDAMTGIVYRDDAQVVEAHVFKSYSDQPGVEITVVEKEIA